MRPIFARFRRLVPADDLQGGHSQSHYLLSNTCARLGRFTQIVPAKTLPRRCHRSAPGGLGVHLRSAGQHRRLSTPRNEVKRENGTLHDRKHHAAPLTANVEANKIRQEPRSRVRRSWVKDAPDQTPQTVARSRRCRHGLYSVS